MMRTTLFIFLMLLFIPGQVLAQVVLNEIMYDLEGSDSGREWIEIFNGGSQTIDLSTWKLFESETNHKLNHIQGTPTVGPGAYVVIADNTEKFLIDWPQYSGALYDSSFSLKNTGELLVLRDENLLDIDSVAYLPDWGGAGDGASVQRINTTWESSSPTPGAQNVQSPVVETEDAGEIAQEGSETNESATAQTQEDAGSFPTTPEIRASAGGDRTAVVGALTEFRGESFGLKQEPLQNARYLWNFGDGTLKEGQALFHTYQYPGTYVVILTVSSGKHSASDKLIVSAKEADIEITFADGDRIELYNRTSVELNISLFRLRARNSVFTIPNNTIVLPNTRVVFPQTVTGLTVSDSAEVALLFPNGVVATVFEKTDTPMIVEQVEQTVAPVPTVSQQKAIAPRISKKPPEPINVVVTRDVEISNEVQKEKGMATEIAAVQASLSPNEQQTEAGIYKWLLALISLISIGIISVLIAGRKTRSLADEYEIIE